MVTQLQLNNVDAHRCQGKSENQINDGGHHINGMSRNEITETLIDWQNNGEDWIALFEFNSRSSLTYRANWNKHKIKRLEKRPFPLPCAINCCAKNHITQQHNNRNWNRQIELVVNLVCCKILRNGGYCTFIRLRYRQRGWGSAELLLHRYYPRIKSHTRSAHKLVHHV